MLCTAYQGRTFTFFFRPLNTTETVFQGMIRFCTRGQNKMNRE
uniref:Uncharacterized protein n=1 Tax=Myoviridae sp. ctVeR24 TaxID=2827689 RepID=A0A8S5SXE5_9CAUD|nr:MAG TPA: hypothetical protein [Myoviridae sp. ctVeR24]